MPIDMTDPDQKELFDKAQRLETLNTNLQTEINAIKTVTADGNTAIANVAVLSSENSNLKTQLEAATNKINRLTSEKESVEKKYNELDSKVRTSTIENKITEALVKNDYDPRFSAALKAMHTGAFKLNDAGEIVNEAGETVEKFFEDFANTDEGKIYLSVGKQSGSGIINNPVKRTNNGAVVNPWAKESFNRTEQLRLMKEKPELAARLKADAGV